MCRLAKGTREDEKSKYENGMMRRKGDGDVENVGAKSG
jgi:hypothetical protein